MDVMLPKGLDPEKIVNAPQIYATVVQVIGGQTEFTLIPAQTKQIKKDVVGELEAAPAFVYAASIWLSPQAARDLALALADAIANYEGRYGTINDTEFSRLMMKKRENNGKRASRTKKTA